MTAAYGVKISCRSKLSARKRPRGPCLPISSNNKNPVTTGGKTSGSEKTASTAALPANSDRRMT